MISVNKVFLIGNLTRDPEIKTTGNGKMARLNLATNKRSRGADGEMKTYTEYHDIVIFQDRLVTIAEDFCRKGTQLMIEGALEHRSYDDQDGNRKYVTEVVLRPFAGELQLGNRPQGEDGGNDRGGNDRGGYDRGGYDRGGQGGGNRGGYSNNRNNDRNNDRNNQGGGNNYQDELDDDIPF